TRETWELVAPALGARLEPTFEDQLYDASPQTVMDVIQETENGCSSLLVIAHNPSLHRVAFGLVAAGDLEAGEQLNEGLPASGLVVIEFPFDDWAKLHAHAGRLLHFVTPDRLKAGTD